MLHAQGAYYFSSSRCCWKAGATHKVEKVTSANTFVMVKIDIIPKARSLVGILILYSAPKINFGIAGGVE
jgi:hypothetical protein